MASGRPSPRHAAEALAPSPTADAPDWPAEYADKIVDTVGKVRDRTTGPAITIARWVVYGTFALLVGGVVIVMLAVAAVRVLDAYLPSAVVGDEHTWAAHLVIGLVFSLVGMFMWSRRSAPADGD